MGLRDFFKRKKAESGEVKPYPKREDIRIDNLGDWIKNKRDDQKDSENNIVILITSRVNQYKKTSEPKLSNLIKFDLEKRKEVKRTKRLVQQGLDSYINQVHSLNVELDNLKTSNLQELISHLNSALTKFEKHSFLGYQRANFLVGDELVEVKKEITGLSKDIKLILEQNKSFAEKSKLLNEMSKLLEEYDEKKKQTEKSKIEIANAGSELETEKDIIKDLEEKVSNIIKSKDYKHNEKCKKDVENLNSKLSEDYQKLKGIVDFKKLINVHHSSSKDLMKIKDYQNSFKENVDKDYEYFLKLLNDAGLLSKIIDNKIDSINSSKIKLKSLKKEIKEDEVVPLEKEIEKINLILKKKKEDKERENKRLEKLINETEEKKNVVKNKGHELGLGIY